MTGDDELFEQLRQAISASLREPPAESIEALHGHVSRRFAPKTEPPWWKQKVAVGAAIFGLVAGTPAAAFAITGTPVPNPLRTALHGIGLPLDSVPVADTKTAEVRLENALGNRDRQEVAKAVSHLQDCLTDLDRSDRARLAPHADALLREAAADTGGDGSTSGHGADSPSAGGSSGGDNQSPSSGQNVPNSGPSGPTVETGGGGGSGLPDGGSGGTGGGDQATTIPPGANSTGTTVPSAATGHDGDQSTTSTTTTSVQRDAQPTTTTTVRSGGGTDGGTDSSDGDTATTTTTTPSH
jgi:hypothetical protein